MAHTYKTKREHANAKEPRRWYARFGVTDDGRIVGEVENSFSMGYSAEHVRVDFYARKTPWPHYVKRLPYHTVLQDTKEEITIVRFFLVRVSRKDCEFEIDWSPRHKKETGKWKWRNLPFTINKWEKIDGQDIFTEQ